MKRFYSIYIIAFYALIYCDLAYAGGVSVGATRIIYPAENKEVAFSVKNSDEKNSYLIQSWAEDSEGSKTSNFVITPPLFVIKPAKEHKLRIMYAGPPLRRDRESLFWLTVKAIPQSEKNSQNTLKLAIASRVKLFWRPTGLPGDSNESWKQLSFVRLGSKLNISNNSAFHVTLTNISFNKKSVSNLMIPPLSKKIIELNENSKGILQYQTLNDYGASTSLQSVSLP